MNRIEFDTIFAITFNYASPLAFSLSLFIFLSAYFFVSLPTKLHSNYN